MLRQELNREEEAQQKKKHEKQWKEQNDEDSSKFEDTYKNTSSEGGVILERGKVGGIGSDLQRGRESEASSFVAITLNDAQMSTAVNRSSDDSEDGDDEENDEADDDDGSYSNDDSSGDDKSDSDSDDNEDDEDDDDDEHSEFSSDEEVSLLHRHGSQRSINNLTKCCLPNRSHRNNKIRQQRRKRFRRKSKKILKVVLSPIIRLYQITKEAVILVTNVDNVWDSPALVDYDDPVVAHYHLQQRHASTSSLAPSIYGTISSADVVPTATPIGSAGSASASSTTLLHSPQGRDVSRSERQVVTFRHKIGVLFWFLVLAFSYATERSSYKVLVDRMGPFRLIVGGQFVMAVHACILGFLMCAQFGLDWRRRRSGSSTSHGISTGRGIDTRWNKGMVMLPLADIGLMGILDSIHLIIAVISGNSVAPVLSVILVNFTIPLTTIFTQFSHPEGLCYGICCHKKNSALSPSSENHLQHNHSYNHETNTNSRTTYGGLTSQHLFGSTLILLSITLSISPALLTLIYPTYFSVSDIMADCTAWNTLLFAFGCIPAAISQMYKEHTLTTFAQPVDSNMLNFLISIVSFIFAMLISPLVYSLQGLAHAPKNLHDVSSIAKVKSWIELYPSNQLRTNFYDSIQCFFGTLPDEDQESKYPEEAHCDFAWGIVITHVLSILIIGFAVDKICNAGAFKIMHRGISAGIILGSVSMMYYQIFVDDRAYGILPNSWDITCSVVLIMGSEVYHRVSLETPTFETVYPEVADLYAAE